MKFLSSEYMSSNKPTDKETQPFAESLYDAFEIKCGTIEIYHFHCFH